MSVSDSDPRTIRTRNRLREAMLKLASEKSFASLSIQDVTRQAGLNRTTFYLHYSGLHELLEDCARTLFEQMRAEIYANPIPAVQRDPAYLAPYAESVFRHLEQHEKFYRAMLGKHGDPLFRGLFQEMLSELIFEPITERKASGETDPHLEMTLRFFSAGFAGVAAWWLEKGKPISVQEAALLIVRSILPDYLRLMND
ncbi:transcriptional regulator [Longilinea arvoryzae]|uniref:Transcriptional regulator n=1 Tax=Longilinea arvoryzae TaxID=360412 RepID=A0A0S7BD47_9CHLR|nr:TetR/AcrR family transcriptional regulator [Longilinea arvoryzae]GAP12720.1 transcriptional regulator [Longilinea arvoryzae]